MELKTNERVRVRALPRTGEGVDVNLDGAVTFTSLPEGHVTIEPIDDTSAWVYGVKNGTTWVYAEGDADLDDDETRHLQSYTQIDVVNAIPEADMIEIEVGTPEVV